MAVTLTNIATGNSTTSSTTLAVSGVTAAIGDLLILSCAADNNGTAGVASLQSTVTDSKGNTWVNRSLLNQTNAGVASDGVSLGIWTCVVTTALSADTITLNFAPATVSKAARVQGATGAAGERAQLDQVGAGNHGFSTTHVGGSATVNSGYTIFGIVAVQTNGAPSTDNDTTNGTWSAHYTSAANTGVGGTSVVVAGQTKTATATGVQDYATTSGGNLHFCANIVIVYSSPTVAAVASAAGVGAASVAGTAVVPAAAASAGIGAAALTSSATAASAATAAGLGATSIVGFGLGQTTVSAAGHGAAAAVGAATAGAAVAGAGIGSAVLTGRVTAAAAVASAGIGGATLTSSATAAAAAAAAGLGGASVVGVSLGMLTVASAGTGAGALVGAATAAAAVAGVGIGAAPWTGKALFAGTVDAPGIGLALWHGNSISTQGAVLGAGHGAVAWASHVTNAGGVAAHGLGQAFWVGGKPPRWGDDLKRLYASAPSGQRYITTLQLAHPAFPQTFWINNSPQLWTFDLGDGTLQDFVSVPFKVALPTQDGKGQQDLQLVLDNVGRDAMEALEDAAAQPQNPITVTVRFYLNVMNSLPQNVPPLVLQLNEVEVTPTAIAGTAGRVDTLNRVFPSVLYRTDTFPGLNR